MVHTRSRSPYVLFSSVVVLLTGALTYVVTDSFGANPIAGFLIAVNMVAVFITGLDKSLSRGASMRIPEMVFYVLSLCGAVIGVFVGMQVFNHKTRKAAFSFVLLVVFAFQLLLWRLLSGQ